MRTRGTRREEGKGRCVAFEGCGSPHRQLMTLRTNLCLLPLTPGLCVFLLVTPFQLIFLLLFCILSSSYGGQWMLLWSLFLFFFFFFFLVLSKKCIKGTMVFLPSPSLVSFHTIFPVTVWAPLQCCSWTW